MNCDKACLCFKKPMRLEEYREFYLNKNIAKREIMTINITFIITNIIILKYLKSPTKR